MATLSIRVASYVKSKISRDLMGLSSTTIYKSLMSEKQTKTQHMP